MRDVDEAKAVKAWLRGLREQAELSQAALADIVGVDRRTIVNAESLKAGFPEGLTLLRMLRELGALREPDAPVQTPVRELRDEAELARESLGKALEGIRLSLARIEARLPGEAEPSREAGT